MKKLFSLIVISAMSAMPFAQDIWFTWTPNPPSELVSSYRIEYQKFPVVTNWTALTSVPGTTNIAVIRGIQGGFIYKFRAFAVNGVGIGTNASTVIQIPTNSPTAVQGFQQTTPR